MRLESDMWVFPEIEIEIKIKIKLKLKLNATSAICGFFPMSILVTSSVAYCKPLTYYCDHVICVV